MLENIYDGFPQNKDYMDLLESDVFKNMEIFSNTFINANGKILGNYMKKWVQDPLHQWSRQWEYPFIFSRIKDSIEHVEEPKILDAGSGITFFSYYLNELFPKAKIDCCDYDKTLDIKYNGINEATGSEIKFSSGDLRKLPYENNNFNLIYCISVLEHTDEYEKIIEEFKRVLKPGGTLLVTFDVSIDGSRDISVEKGKQLVRSLENHFSKDSEVLFEFGDDLFTTYSVKDVNKDLLPWRLPAFVYRLKALIKKEKFSVWPPNLTVFCLTLTKKEEKE